MTSVDGPQCGQRKDLHTGEGKRYPDGKCIFWGGINNRAVECAARNKPQRFKAAGVEIKAVGTDEGSDGRGKAVVNLGKVTP